MGGVLVSQILHNPVCRTCSPSHKRRTTKEKRPTRGKQGMTVWLSSLYTHAYTHTYIHIYMQSKYHTVILPCPSPLHSTAPRLAPLPLTGPVFDPPSLHGCIVHTMHCPRRTAQTRKPAKAKGISRSTLNSTSSYREREAIVSQLSISPSPLSEESKIEDCNHATPTRHPSQKSVGDP